MEQLCLRWQSVGPGAHLQQPCSWEPFSQKSRSCQRKISRGVAFSRALKVVENPELVM